jgi:tRNA(fMet)-specific endonuclease VapC
LSVLHILDTDTLSLYERGQETVMAKVNAVPPNQVAVAVITVEEQMVGRMAYLRSAKGDKETAFAYQRFTDSVRSLSDFHIITFSEAAIVRYNALLALKLNVGKMDLRIAAIALEAGATIITRNLRDFERVPGLACENWAD